MIPPVVRTNAWLTIALLLAAPASVVLALRYGSASISSTDLWLALTGSNNLAATVIFDLRLPRALTAFAVGGMLALAGALLQVLLRNPLADPYVLGISGGASVAALLAIAVGFGAAATAGAAFAGAGATMFLVFGLSRAGAGPHPSHRLLLTGVVIASGFGAGVSLILALSPAEQLHGMLFWLLGDLSHGEYPGAGLAVLTVCLVLAFLIARPLNLLARGERVAAALGENPAQLRTGVYFLASALSATAVMLAGNIGFIGLIVPHVLRLLGSRDHRHLLPHAALLGGSFLVVADTFARVALAPVQLPTGVVTALLGVPAFLFLLARAHRH